MPRTAPNTADHAFKSNSCHGINTSLVIGIAKLHLNNENCKKLSEILLTISTSNVPRTMSIS